MVCGRDAASEGGSGSPDTALSRPPPRSGRWRRPAAEATTGHAALWHATATAGCLIDLHHDRVYDALELFLLGLEFVLLGQLVLVEPVQRVLHGLFDLLLVATLEFVPELLLIQGVPHGEAVVLEAALGLDLHLVGLVLSPELFGLLHHAVDLGLRKSALLVGDGDLVRLPGGLVLGRDVENAVRVNVEGDLNLGHATGSGRDPVEVELAKQVVVLRHRALTLKDLDEHTWLVVSIGREGLPLLGGDGGVPLDQLRHDTTGSLE